MIVSEQYPTVICIDPCRISERSFGGPHFRSFCQISPNRIMCLVNRDVFDTRGLHDAWMEGRNLAPIIYGKTVPVPKVPA